MSAGSMIFGFFVPSHIIRQNFAGGRDIYHGSIILDFGFHRLFLIS